MSRESNTRRHTFLNEYFFPEATGYSIKHINNWVLERRFNANTEVWEVAIFTKESYEKAQDFYKSYLKTD